VGSGLILASPVSYSWLAIIPMLMFAYCFLQAAFFSGYIAFDAARRKLIVFSRGLIPRRSQTSFSTTDVSTVDIRKNRSITGSSSSLRLVRSTGGYEEMPLPLYHGERPEEVARAVADVIGARVTKEGKAVPA
jgi:hypothetical protein